MELNKGTEEVVKAEIGKQRFISKKGSVIPRKRRSVKKMVLHSIATYLCCLNHHSTSSFVETSSLPKTPADNYAKNVKIFPHYVP